MVPSGPRTGTVVSDRRPTYDEIQKLFTAHGSVQKSTTDRQPTLLWVHRAFSESGRVGGTIPGTTKQSEVVFETAVDASVQSLERVGDSKQTSHRRGAGS